MIEYNCTVYYKDMAFEVHFNRLSSIEAIAEKLYRIDLSRYELSELCYALINCNNLSSFLEHLIDYNIIKGYELQSIIKES